ncbi:MAG: PD-(D/E)XK nuclease family protein [Leptolyngbyaceae bacterium]|nr:PD-(D/E)XK nuclease family protein [Leptolyngbyaceae bacterium]
MAYQLSATKLQSYHRCPQAYYFRYELGMKSPAFFGSASLGTALHQSLAKIYWGWHYQSPLPDLDWIHQCWSEHSGGLSPDQTAEGRAILENYYDRFIASETALIKPVAVEGRIQSSLQVENLEFTISGRYDRLDILNDGLELIDYKSTKEVKLPNSDEIDLQIGLYYLALEQKYHQSLKRLSLLYLRTAEKISFEATPEHKQQVQATISELACRLRTDQAWEPTPGEACDRCTYARYCPALQAEPEPLPCHTKTSWQMQLTLGL